MLLFFLEQDVVSLRCLFRLLTSASLLCLYHVITPHPGRSFDTDVLVEQIRPRKRQSITVRYRYVRITWRGVSLACHVLVSLNLLQNILSWIYDIALLLCIYRTYYHEYILNITCQNLYRMPYQPQVHEDRTPLFVPISLMWPHLHIYDFLHKY